MQGLEIGGHQNSGYGPMDNIPDLGPHPPAEDLNFENLDTNLPPSHGGDTNQGMAWYDTDL